MEPDFSDADLEWFERLYDTVVEANKRMNLTRITEREEFFFKHILDSALPFFLVPALTALPEELRAADLGSGAGFPGLVLARLRPGWQMALIERTQKKATFLEEAARALGLSNVTVLAANASEAAIPRRDLVTARAVGPIADVTRAAKNLLRKNGLLVHYKGGALDESEFTKGYEAAKGCRMAQDEPIAYSLPNGDRRTIVIARFKGLPHKRRR